MALASLFVLHSNFFFKVCFLMLISHTAPLKSATCQVDESGDNAGKEVGLSERLNMARYRLPEISAGLAAFAR